MSGFTIPGLGFAKPNETLPPVPADILVAAASLGGDDVVMGEKNGEQKVEPSKDDVNTEAAAPPDAQKAAEEHQTSSTATAQPDPDSMNVDSPPSPPSLTSALEAALGPAEPMNTEEQSNAPQQATSQTQPGATQQNGEGEQREWETDSSPLESSSESSSSDSSSDDDDDDDDDDNGEGNEGYELLGVDETVRMLMEAASDDENEGGGGRGANAGQLRTKNELPPEVIPKPDVTIAPETKIEPLGEVDQIVENILVVKAYTPGEYQVLDTGSVLCTEDRTVFGVVCETIGKVLQPMYTVMFTTAEEIAEAGLKTGTKVFYPVNHASYVFTQPLRNLKGSDASNIHDEEVGDEEMEFSDDEKEAEYKRQVKQKKREGKAARGGASRGGGREPHPLRNEVKPDATTSSGLNYDDEDDGPYKPLPRPASFGQGPPIEQSFIQEPEPQPRFGAYRGRADFRGRGNRGRDRGRGGRGRGGGGGGGGGFQHRGDSRDGHTLPPAPGGHQWPQPQPPQQQQAQQQPMSPAPPPPQLYQQQTPSYNPAAAFNFNIPVPQPGQGGFPAVPPPPPNWAPAPQSAAHVATHGQQQGGQQQNVQGAYLNPAFLAALLGQMQQQKQAGGGDGQAQWQPPQPPPPQ
ncbi:NAF1-domain-containing protein [Sodiomyces alkalinus F11]|uniref:H/ACA ribonucleoprotein complex non-core subunit NAF1 n=1 Tax=Sodiomyces alkalinus (strain CBS 110278 / VKM F-3762 / F11) TaxID=1314773 RepID=A0A3N2Q6C9_SODAK|nr:NAF1-domain-containing protein [Sodiomyces alkalinus F11]ROT42175.1 NAF1-domain-containing protein [Sodiomyces alkalinus F11]